jgi:signal transduction histidine kinase/DNA-binding response OmpR family regulator
MVSARFEELETLLSNTTDEQQKIEIKLDQVAELRQFDLIKSLMLAKQTRKQAIDISYEKGIARSTYHVGLCYWHLGDYDLGILELNEGLKFAKKRKDIKLEAKCNNILGSIYRDIGELSTALKYYLIALETFESIKDEHTTGVVMKNISNLHFDLFDYDNALDYALKSVHILEKYENRYRIITIYYSLGNIYFKKENYKEALTYFFNCLELSEPNTANHALATSGIGKVYYSTKELSKAQNYLMHAYEAGVTGNFFESFIISNFYLARIALDNNQAQSAKEALDKAMTSAKEHNRKHDIMSIHEYLSKVYEHLGDIQNAYFHLKEFENLKSTIFQQDAINRLRNMQTKHEIAFAHKEKEVAERTATLKQQFLANMSHEIRTPMNAIVGMARLLQTKEKLPHQTKYLNAIQNSADNLLVIINDILDLSKLEAGKIDLEQIPFSIEEAVNNVYQMLKYKAEDKKLSFKINIENNIPNVVLGDPTRLTQVLINLAGNGIKFTENGSVIIKVSIFNTLLDKVTINFEVIDTGVGINEGYVNNIFEKFTQAGSDTARKYGGTGLGLSISKQLLELMDGEIQVKSAVGEGTTFSFQIPYLIAKEEVVNKKQELTVNNNQKNILNKLQVLLVEDNEFNQILAVDTLKEIAPDISIDIANNGKVAVNKATNKLYDIILMDIQMPEMNGVEATKLIRSTLKVPHSQVKIIAMTANVMKEDIESYLEAGMNEYVSKPFNTEVLVHKIISLQDTSALDKRNTSIKMDINEEEQISNAISQVTDLAFLNTFTQNDATKQKKYIKLFLDNAPELLSTAFKALETNNYNQIKISVHSLKSQLNYMGVKEEVSKVYATEKACEDLSQQANLPNMLKHLNLICSQAFKELNEVINA